MATIQRVHRRIAVQRAGCSIQIAGGGGISGVVAFTANSPVGVDDDAIDIIFYRPPVDSGGGHMVPGDHVTAVDQGRHRRLRVEVGAVG
ncbi:hypothetical protein D3C71_1825050 [compost metagenome]